MKQGPRPSGGMREAEEKTLARASQPRPLAAKELGMKLQRRAGRARRAQLQPAKQQIKFINPI